MVTMTAATNESWPEDECSELTADWNYDSTGWIVLGYLQIGYVPVISLAGILGNCLSMLIFLRTNLRTRSSSYYLAALAAADTAFLVQLLVVSLIYLDVDLYNREGGCQTLVFASSVSTFLSVWLVVGFTVERFIAIQYPLQRPKMCTVRRAKRTICGLVLLALAANSYLPFTAVTVRDHDGRTVCDFHPHFRHAFYVINVVDTIATLVLPVTLIVVMNSMIAVQLLRFSRSHRRAEREEQAVADARATRSTYHPMSLVVNGLTVRDVSIVGAQRSTTSTSSHSLKSHNNNNHAFHQQKSVNVVSRHYPYGYGSGSRDRNLRQNNVTKMLLLISTTFVTLNFPSYVMRLHNYYNRNCVSEDAYILQQYTMLLFYTNFSTNFLLYSTCGISFRRALCDLARRNFR